MARPGDTDSIVSYEDDSMIGQTRYSIAGGVMRVHSFGVPRCVLSFAQRLDPTAIHYTPGAIHLYTSDPGSRVTLANTLCFPRNKVLDVLLMLDLPRAEMLRHATIYSGCSPPANADEIRERNSCLASLLLLSYISSGSLRKTQDGTISMPRYFLQVAGLRADDFQYSALCSVAHGERAKFPGMLENWFRITPGLHRTVRRRCRIAGNRVHAILNMMRRLHVDVSREGPFWQLAMSDPVLDGALYISFHPDHPANPMANHAACMFAHMGRLLRTRVADLEEFMESDGVFGAPEVRASLLADP